MHKQGKHDTPERRGRTLTLLLYPNTAARRTATTAAAVNIQLFSLNNVGAENGDLEVCAIESCEKHGSEHWLESSASRAVRRLAVVILEFRSPEMRSLVEIRCLVLFNIVDLRTLGFVRGVRGRGRLQQAEALRADELLPDGVHEVLQSDKQHHPFPRLYRTDRVGLEEHELLGGPGHHGGERDFWKTIAFNSRSDRHERIRGRQDCEHRASACSNTEVLVRHGRSVATNIIRRVHRMYAEFVSPGILHSDGMHVRCKEWETHDIATVVTYVLILVSFGFNIFIFCYIGELIAEQCSRVGEVAYMIDWYNLQGKKKQCLIMIIAMSNSSSKLTAGGMVELSLSTFGDVRIQCAIYVCIFCKCNRNVYKSFKCVGC
ncbi:uncharacterized protein LOC143352972 isoform X5 [Halictus rubicundus]|uniref:uncharacterized protein LOC143352972 isoform X5 n=1 Tax=Halictus rubicundus TaxID=77578 RepID=UPI004036396D